MGVDEMVKKKILRGVARGEGGLWVNTNLNPGGSAPVNLFNYAEVLQRTRRKKTKT